MTATALATLTAGGKPYRWAVLTEAFTLETLPADLWEPGTVKGDLRDLSRMHVETGEHAREFAEDWLVKQGRFEGCVRQPRPIIWGL